MEISTLLMPCLIQGCVQGCVQGWKTPWNARFSTLLQGCKHPL